MNTTETTKTTKELFKEHVKTQTGFTERRAAEFRVTKEKEEKIWKDYFEEIKKHSDKFQLVVTPKTQNFDVNCYPVDENGNKEYSSGYITVKTLEVNYNIFDIKYIGELPPGTQKYSLPNVFVEEHITYGRRGFGRTNHGYKLKIEIDYKPKYYRTAKKVVELFNEFIESRWESHRIKERQKDTYTRAYNLLKEKFKFLPVSHQDGVFVVENYNDTRVFLFFRENNLGEIVFSVKKVEVRPEHNLEKLVQSLGYL